jgi:hypothetical protein
MNETPQKEKSMDDTFLPPIEKPQGLMMKLAYYFTRRQFGRVLTPLKVHSARLPVAFGSVTSAGNSSDISLTRRLESSFGAGRMLSRLTPTPLQRISIN